VPDRLLVILFVTINEPVIIALPLTFSVEPSSYTILFTRSLLDPNLLI
jgi:hypothetical protein